MDNIIGTAGNDTIDGIAGGGATNTFGGLDVINGGAGNDTLVLTNAAGTMTLATSVTVSNIENLSLRSAQNAITADVQSWTGLQNVNVEQLGNAAAVTVTTKSNATSVNVTAGTTATGFGARTVTINDNGSAATTADTLASVSVTGAKGAITVGSDALTSLTLVDSTVAANVTNTTVGHTLNVTANKQSGAAGVTDAAATTVNVTATGANSTAFAVTAAAADAINFAGDKNLTATLSAQKAGLKITSATEGTLVIATALNNDVTFTGGAGKETITISNANTKATAMGAGDDVVNVVGAVLGANGTIDGGDGVDTIAMSAADAAALSALTPADTYEKRISNFEKVGLGQVAAFANNTVNLANLDDISYVVSAGTAAGTGSAEVATVTFNGLLSGQSVTITDGVKTQTVTAAADMTAAQVADAFNTGFAADSLDDTYTVSVAGNVATLTASGVGNQANVTSTVANSTVTNLGTAVTAAGSAAVTAVAEVATVGVSGLIAGEAVTVTSAGGLRTVTATAINETASTAFTDVVTTGAGGSDVTVVVNGVTVSLADSVSAVTYTGAEIAAAIANGSTTTAGGGTITITGTLNGYTATATGAAVTFNATTLASNVTDITITGDAYVVAPTVTITQGSNGNLTAGQVAAALASGATSGAAVTTNTMTDYNGAATGSTVTFTAMATGDTADLTATSTGGTQPTVDVTTPGVTGVPGVTESADVTFTALKSGQQVLVAGRTVTANGADLIAAEVEAAYLGGVNAGAAVIGGTLSGWTVADVGSLGDGTLRFTSTTANTNVINIDAAGYGVSAAAAATAAAIAVVDGTTTAGGGNLTLTNVANAGTLELTGNNNGSITVTMKDATGTADSLNLKLNGAANLVGGAVNVAGVETIAIEATDSSADTVTVTNPLAASTLALNAAAATSITLSGNHGVNFTGSTLTKVTSLDASGVVANVNTTGLTAAQIIEANGVAGRVTFTTVVDDKAVTITTGNGNDAINAATVGTAADVTAAATISTGAGRDTITGGADADVIDAGADRDVVFSSTGADTITLGAGNDVFVLSSNTHSVLATFDTITDFNANTKGQGTAGAANQKGAFVSVETDGSDLTGDTINVSALFSVGVDGLKVLVVSNAADAQTFIQNTANVAAGTAANYTGFALDSSSNLLYMDFNQDGAIDSVIKLTGVTTITEAAFVTGL